jgi:adenosylhomocysteine nucleosidase
MSVGVSGGLDPGLKPGDLIAASSVLEAGARPFEYTSERQRHWANRMVGSFANMGLTARSGKLLSAARPVLSVAAKRDLFRRTGALAVDMETAAAAEVAEKTNLPFMALRSVCDPAHRPVPHQLFDCLDSDGRVRLPVLILTLLKEPSLLPRLLQAQQDFSRAARALRRGWPACVRILSAGNSGAAG